MLSKTVIFIAIIAVACVSASRKDVFLSSRYVAHQHKQKVGTVDFVPHPLPCSYQIKVQATVNDTSVCEPDGICSYQTLDVRQHFKRLELKTTDPDDYTLFYVRSDINYTEGNETMVAVFSSDKVENGEACYLEMEPLDEIEKGIKKNYEIIFEESHFDHVEPSEFQGAKCKKYTFDDADDVAYFATDDNLVIGMIEVEEGAEYTVRFSYLMKVPLSTFIIQRTEMEGCNETAYQLPNGDVCIDDDASTMVKAIFSLVIASILFTLLSFF